MSCTALVELEPEIRSLPRPAVLRREKTCFDIGQTTVRWAVALLAGGLHAAGWLYPGAWYAVWLAQAVTIALAVHLAPRPAFFYGLVTGAFGIGCSFYWGVAALYQTFDATPFTAWTIFTLLVAMEAMSWAFFSWAVSHFARRGIHWLWLIPCVWVAAEHWLPRVFPWKVGYSQLEVLPLLQIADLLGSSAIGFVVTAAAAIPAILWLGFFKSQRREQRRLAMQLVGGASALLLLTLLYGGVQLRQWDEWTAQQPKLRVAAIQIDPINMGSEHSLRSRSLAVHERVDLICWPESSLGIYSDDLTHFRDRNQTRSLSIDSHHCLEPALGLACPLLAGGKAYRPGSGQEGPFAMTAFLIDGDQEIVGRYRKRTLLPFGEYIPGQKWWPAVREWATLRDVVEAGNDPRPLTSLAGHRLGLVICYEDTLPPNARKTVAAGAEVLFSIIQGTAFDNPLTLVQHQRLAALRAVENRRYFVRCASTGMTCVISPTGRILGNLPVQTEGTLVSDIALVQGRTLYNRLGEAFPLLCTGLLIVGWRWPKR